jgi:RNA polymerase sigma-70 factor (ECF subfamily)
MKPLLDGVFRESAGRIVSTLTRILGSRHLELAEECVQDAMIRAMETWPFHGVPDNPQAWLLQAARNRAIDILRRDRKLTPAIPDLMAAGQTGSAIDDELGMILLCCHPALPRESQVALTLKTVGGLGVKEIARAYLVPDPTIAQRLVRAKRQIREEGLRFDLPDAIADIPARLDAVLEVLYLLFNEGYTLCANDISDEAIRLARLLTASAATALPKCHALLALMLLQAARDAARLDAEGSVVLLREQDRGLWNRSRIAEGFHHLDRAGAGHELTRYHLEASIASHHAMAESWEATDWIGIARAYELLEALHPSPVVRLNHAVAMGQIHGPQVGLDLLQGLEPHLAGYQPFHAARGYFWRALQDTPRAVEAYSRALQLSRNRNESAYFRTVLRELGSFREVLTTFA